MTRQLCFAAALSLAFCSGLHAAVEDSSTFTYQYNGDQIFDSINLLPPWAILGGIEEDDLSLNGTNLVISPLSGADADDNNGWIQQDGDTTPWDTPVTGVVNQARWALEVSADLNDNDLQTNDNIVIWAEGGGNRQMIIIAADSVSTFGGTVLDTNDNTDAQHVFQLQYNANDLTADASGTYQLYRDGVHIGADLARESGQGLSRLIVGDCCTSLGNPVDEYEIGHVRFDTIIPEPASLLLVGMSLVGLTSYRKRR